MNIRKLEISLNTKWIILLKTFWNFVNTVILTSFVLIANFSQMCGIFIKVRLILKSIDFSSIHISKIISFKLHPMKQFIFIRLEQIILAIHQTVHTFQLLFVQLCQHTFHFLVLFVPFIQLDQYYRIDHINNKNIFNNTIQIFDRFVIEVFVSIDLQLRIILPYSYFIVDTILTPPNIIFLLVDIFQIT